MHSIHMGLRVMGLLALCFSSAVAAQGVKITPTSAYGSTNLQPAANAIDSNPATRWESNYGVSPSSLTLDLGRQQTLSQIVIDWEAANASDYTVLGSNDN
ncbi:MAG: discoidin domain-containing protein, partial [Lysobacterales bacterium]